MIVQGQLSHSRTTYRKPPYLPKIISCTPLRETEEGLQTNILVLVYATPIEVYLRMPGRIRLGILWKCAFKIERQSHLSRDSRSQRRWQRRLSCSNVLHTSGSNDALPSFELKDEIHSYRHLSSDKHEILHGEDICGVRTCRSQAIVGARRVKMI
jgi:hypothetical protein